MQGAGIFCGTLKRDPSPFDKLLVKIPGKGPIDRRVVRNYLKSFIDMPNMGIAGATRLLTMKRPDLFFSANNAMMGKAAEVFGFRPNTVARYMQALTLLDDAPWYKSAKPSDPELREIWQAKCALIDTYFYETT